MPLERRAALRFRVYHWGGPYVRVYGFGSNNGCDSVMTYPPNWAHQERIRFAAILPKTLLCTHPTITAQEIIFSENEAQESESPPDIIERLKFSAGYGTFHVEEEGNKEGEHIQKSEGDPNCGPDEVADENKPENGEEDWNKASEEKQNRPGLSKICNVTLHRTIPSSAHTTPCTYKLLDHS